MLRKRSGRSKSAPKKSTGETSTSLGHQPAASPAQLESIVAPEWFSWACSEPMDTIRVRMEDPVDGKVDIHCLRWGSSKSKRGLVMVHGGGANAYWYKFIAPFFASEFDVIAITNSGNCDSGQRKEQYTADKWSEEILHCTQYLGLFDDNRPPPYIVAHSMGVFVTLNLLRGKAFPGACTRFGGVILCDGAIRSAALAATVQERVLQLRANDPTLKPRAGWVVNPPSTTPLMRFKLRPYQECNNTYIMKFIAESAREIVDEDGSWCWKGDPNRDAKFQWHSMPVLCDEDVRKIALQIPTVFMYGDHSVLCDSSVVEFVRKSLGKHIGVIGIPCAAHHVWLDQPLSFVSAVRGIFAGWPSGLDAAKAEEIEQEESLRREALLESRL